MQNGGEVQTPYELTPARMAALPRIKIQATAHGQTSSFEGIALFEILKAAGVHFGEQMRGKDMRLFLLVQAADGYQAIFALPELDPTFTDKRVILADRVNGAALSKEDGVPDEKRPARWVRRITVLKVLLAAP